MRTPLGSNRMSRSRVARSSQRLCTSCVQEGGFEGPENGPKQRRINNRLLSYRPTLRLVQTIMRQLFAIIKVESIWDHQLAIAPNLATTSFLCLALKCVYLLVIFNEVWPTHFVIKSPCTPAS